MLVAGVPGAAAGEGLGGSWVLPAAAFLLARSCGKAGLPLQTKKSKVQVLYKQRMKSSKVDMCLPLCRNASLQALILCISRRGRLLSFLLFEILGGGAGFAFLRLAGSGVIPERRQFILRQVLELKRKGNCQYASS